MSSTDNLLTPQTPSSSTLLPPDHLQSQKQNTLQTSIDTLTTKITQIQTEIAEIKSKLQNDPSVTVKRHIRLLHEYNEIKDVGQGLLGLIADARGVRQIDVQREFGVGDKD